MFFFLFSSLVVPWKWSYSMLIRNYYSWSCSKLPLSSRESQLCLPTKSILNLADYEMRRLWVFQRFFRRIFFSTFMIMIKACWIFQTNEIFNDDEVNLRKAWEWSCQFVSIFSQTLFIWAALVSPKRKIKNTVSCSKMSFGSCRQKTRWRKSIQRPILLTDYPKYPEEGQAREIQCCYKNIWMASNFQQ